MGTLIFLEHSDGRSVEGWDASANAGAGQIRFALKNELPFTDLGRVEDGVKLRPADFPSWRRFLSKSVFPNADKYLWMLDQLEAEPSMYINITH